MCSEPRYTTRGLTYGDMTRSLGLLSCLPRYVMPFRTHTHNFALYNPMCYASISIRPVLRSQRHICTSETNETPTKTKVPTYGPRFNTLRPSQNGPHFPDDIFKRIFLNAKWCILINISLKFVPQGPINNIPLLVQIIAWCRSGDKP